MAYLELSADSKRSGSGAREPRLRVNKGVLGRRPGVDRASTGTRQARIARQRRRSDEAVLQKFELPIKETTRQ
jgi:hypothetical protein